jgi:hypothetical protein
MLNNSCIVGRLIDFGLSGISGSHGGDREDVNKGEDNLS